MTYHAPECKYKHPAARFEGRALIDIESNIQKSAVPLATRLRENQRRSRLRQKEFVEHLQTRLREYESNELRATLDMQAAARRVAWENAQLRDLLVDNGISPMEIENFLRARECGRGHVASSPASKPSPQSNAGAQAQQVNESTAMRSGTSITENQMIVNDDSVEALRSSSQAGYPTQGVGIDNGKNERGYDLTALSADAQHQAIPLTGSNDRSTSPCASALSAQHDSQLQMSCEAAASIISGMRGTDDRELALSQLGCTDNTSCSVKNITVLQIMEMD